MRREQIGLIAFMAGLLTTVGAEERVEIRDTARRGRAFLALTEWTRFQKETAEKEVVTLTSPELPTEIPAKEVIVSWNVSAPKGSGLTVEAKARCGENETRWYTLGRWSPDAEACPRESVPGQKDENGDVATDTLVLTKPADAVTVRATLRPAPDGRAPTLKFLGVSLADTTALPPAREPNRAAFQYGFRGRFPRYSCLRHPLLRHARPGRLDRSRDTAYRLPLL
jgi:hypothetical protein